MATIMSHALVAATLTRLCKIGYSPAPESGLIRRRIPLHLLVLTAVCSALPDIDVLAFNFGIPYEAPLGHRGFTHSIVFAILTAAAAVVCYAKIGSRYRQQKCLLFILIFLATVSHGLLDALTDGGHGVAFFSPFDNSRYFFPVRPLKVSPIGGYFFSKEGLTTVLNEVYWLGIPCFVILAGCAIFIRKRE